MRSRSRGQIVRKQFEGWCAIGTEPAGNEVAVPNRDPMKRGRSGPKWRDNPIALASVGAIFLILALIWLFSG